MVGITGLLADRLEIYAAMRCVTKGYTEGHASAQGTMISAALIKRRSYVASLPMVILCSGSATPGRTRTPVQWHWDIHVNLASRDRGGWSFTNKRGGGSAGRRQCRVQKESHQGSVAL